MTPYELRYKIYEDARTILQSEYEHLCEEYEMGNLAGKPPAFPTHARIMSLAKEINEFIVSKKEGEDHDR
jgi:hypothetical protein